MKRITCLVIVQVLFFFSTAFAFLGFFDKAKEYDEKIEKALATHEMGITAESLDALDKIHKELTKLIQENPENYDIYFELCKAEFLIAELGHKARNDIDPHNKFRILAAKSRGHTARIFDFYITQSKRYAAINNRAESLVLAVAAYRDFQSNDARARTAATEIYNNGIGALNQGDIHGASLYFRSALRIVPGMRQTIHEKIITVSNQASDPNLGLKTLAMIYALFPESDWAVANKVVETLVKKNKPVKADLIPVNLPAFKQLPNQVQVVIITLVFPPDFITYYRGQKKVFVLKADEYSDHFVKVDQGVTVRFQRGYGDFEMVTRSGKHYTSGKIPEYFNEDFRIRAINNCDMRLVFE